MSDAKKLNENLIPKGHNMQDIMYLRHVNEILGRLFEDINSFHSKSSEVLSINISGGS